MEGKGIRGHAPKGVGTSVRFLAAGARAKAHKTKGEEMGSEWPASDKARLKGFYIQIRSSKDKSSTSETKQAKGKRPGTNEVLPATDPHVDVDGEQRCPKCGNFTESW